MSDVQRAANGAQGAANEAQTIAREDVLSGIQACEAELEAAVNHFEQPGLLEQALQVYWQVEVELEALKIVRQDPEYARLQAVLAQCLLRQASILRQFGQVEKAAELNERELAAAKASGDALIQARSLMSYGTTCIVQGEPERGLAYLEQARQLFAMGEGDDFRQGFGWYWILRADLDNARITGGGPQEALAAADRALALLQPLANWPGIARAWAARAIAAEALGDLEAVGAARQAGADASARVAPGVN